MKISFILIITSGFLNTQHHTTFGEFYEEGAGKPTHPLGGRNRSIPQHFQPLIQLEREE
jgi:hypothetical protein